MKLGNKTFDPRANCLVPRTKNFSQCVEMRYLKDGTSLLGNTGGVLSPSCRVHDEEMLQTCVTEPRKHGSVTGSPSFSLWQDSKECIEKGILKTSIHDNVLS